MRKAVFAGGPPFDLSEEDLDSILKRRQLPCDPDQYRLARIAEWSRPRYALDRRFVALCLLLDQGEDNEGPRWERRNRYHDLREVLSAEDAPALVLLGPPGAGKSTLLRHLDLDLAVAAVRGESDEISIFIPLSGYHEGEPPGNWLEKQWAERYPVPPSLETLAREQPLRLLLDGLNEMPYKDKADYRSRIAKWRAYLASLSHSSPGTRVIFSCRSLDYSAPLSTSALRVPQIDIESLDDDQVKAFLIGYSKQGEALWDRLKGTPQLALYRSPYYLKLLLAQVGEDGKPPRGRAGLFAGFVRQALRREIMESHNPLLEPGCLLDDNDNLRLMSMSARWQGADLPEDGPLLPMIALLAYRMQKEGITQGGGQLRVGYSRALTLIGDPADDLLKAGADIGVLDRDLAKNEIAFIHQLIQEHFAARALAKEPEPQLAHTEWRADRVRPNLEETLAGLGEADPLPPAETTGWEETQIQAVAMTRDPEAFVTALAKHNLPLAGYCAAQPDVDLHQWLIARTEDPAADLRARIAAAHSLGGLGDPRFARKTGPEGDAYLTPPLIDISPGRYSIGSNEEGCGDLLLEHVHEVNLKPFALGKFPVTNAEWRLFMEAGGYEGEGWLETEEGKAWRGKAGSEVSR